MRISQLTISGFQSFAFPTTIPLDDLTVFIGANGAGKTAVLVALCRLFGTVPEYRRIVVDDFYVGRNERRDDVNQRDLSIEARIDFPELDGESNDMPTVPAMFNQMVVREPGGAPHCRIRLDARWERSRSSDGTIEEELYWVTEPGDPQASASTTARRPVAARDRDRIQVTYVPASRDATKQLANASGTLLRQLLKAIDWSDPTRTQIKESAERLRDLMMGVEGIRRITDFSRTSWSELYDEDVYREPSLHFVPRDLADVLADARIVFNPTHGSKDHDMSRLSDGQKSLFYFAFINAIFTLERQVFDAHHSAENASTLAADHFAFDLLRPAALTIFALEEPENHLGPHYLGRIVRQITQIANNSGAQVFFTTHAPAIVGRIDPAGLRFFRCDRASGVTSVRQIRLPAEQDEAAKYVREAVRAYPELYFARVVVLGEGDSEMIVLPRFAEAMGQSVDSAMIAVVPLGGRHVNHFWRLLSDLAIPHATLLDLDSGRSQGGWARIKYVVAQLLRALPPERHAELLALAPNGGHGNLAVEELDLLVANDAADTTSMTAWTNHLRRFHVFFSAPLDLDLLMLQTYTEAYKSTAVQGPRSVGQDGDATAELAARTVLGRLADPTIYESTERDLFRWYAYLFLGRGKPATHLLAWTQIVPSDRLTRMPEVIRSLLIQAAALASPTSAGISLASGTPAEAPAQPGIETAVAPPMAGIEPNVDDRPNA